MNFYTKKNFKIFFFYKIFKENGKSFLKKKITILNGLSFFLFFFSFLEIIYFKYQNRKFFFFFENKFPIKMKLEEKLSWETFNFFKIKYFSFLEKKQNIIQYNVYNNYFLIEVRKKIFFASLGLIKKKFFLKSNFQICFKNSKFIIFADNLILFFDLKKNLLYPKFLNFVFFEKIIYDLDILPLKINEVDILYQKKQNFFYFKKNKKLNNLSEEKKIKKLFFFLEKKSFVFKGIGEKNNFFSVFRKKNMQFFEEKKYFQNEINLFLYENNLFYFENKAGFLDFSKNNYSFISKEEFIVILENFFKKKFFEYVFPRLHSGYNFTDLRKNEKSNIIFYYFLNNKQYKIIFPFYFLFFLKNTIFLSFENFYYSNLSKKKNNYFIIVPSEEKIQNNFKTTQSDIKNLKTFSLKNKQTFLKSKEIKEIKEIKEFKEFKEIEEIEEIKEIKEIEEIEEINDFFVKNIFFFFDLKKKQKINFFDDKEILLKKNFFLKFFTKKKKTKNIVTKNQPFSEKLFDKNYKIKKHSFLKKENFTPISKKFCVFSQNWEGLSCSSWLFITQFIISLFFFKILKDVYENYGKELIQFVINFLHLAETDLNELKKQYYIKNNEYKIIRKTKKQFKDIVGIDFILAETGEILWLLKNLGRSAKYKKSIPKGILLTGPPGTGKTLLVQAIARETKVPVIVQSATLLIDPKKKGQSAKKLKKVFQKARFFAPCIIFIDEIDSLGRKRQKLYKVGNNSDKFFQKIYEKKRIKKNFCFQSALFSNKKINRKNFSVYLSKNSEEQKTKLHLFTQFLIEMDGLKTRKGVFVFGATNRVEILDPALIRPGRFDKIIPLPTPSKNKRIKILKLYSKRRKIEKKISWNYLANRMIQCNAADIAAIMNESSIQSIIQKTTHTVETIEKGIDYITSYSVLKKKKNNLLQNKAYYQSGKAVSYVLFSKKKRKKGIFLSLWDKKKNTRYEKSFHCYFFENQSRKALEFFLISSHFGKVGELIFLFGKKNKKAKYFESDYGHKDRALLSRLATFLIKNWFFYSTKNFLRQENKTLLNFSIIEKTEYTVFLSKLFENEIELDKKNKISTFYQQRNFYAWWEQEITKRVSKNEALFSDWYRLFLPDPEESLLNLEWIPPDLIIHNNKLIKKLGNFWYLNHNSLYTIERDFIFQSLILNTFDFAFSKEENLRQFLDFFSDQLIRYEILRASKISKIYKVK